MGAKYTRLMLCSDSNTTPTCTQFSVQILNHSICRPSFPLPCVSIYSPEITFCATPYPTASLMPVNNFFQNAPQRCAPTATCRHVTMVACPNQRFAAYPPTYHVWLQSSHTRGTIHRNAVREFMKSPVRNKLLQSKVNMERSAHQVLNVKHASTCPFQRHFLTIAYFPELNQFFLRLAKGNHARHTPSRWHFELAPLRTSAD